jgi:hypothetical protein
LLVGEQDFQRVDEIAGSLAVRSSDRCGEFLLKRVHECDRLLGDGDTAAGEAELHRAGIGRMLGAHNETRVFERAGELGDEDRLEAGPVGELALAGVYAG